MDRISNDIQELDKLISLILKQTQMCLIQIVYYSLKVSTKMCNNKFNEKYVFKVQFHLEFIKQYLTG